MRFQPGFRYGASTAVIAGALALLSGETDGFAIDATSYDSVTAASYVGGPVGGTVATIDTGTPANDLSNVPLDASNLVNSGTSPKMVHHAASPYVRWSAHNLCIQSQTIDNASWTKTNTTITADDTTAPDGTATADKAVESNTSNSSFQSTASTTVVGFPYVASVYIKPSNNTWASMFVQQSGGGDGIVIWFDVVNGTVGSSALYGTASWTIGAGSITSAGNGWYRCSLWFITGDTTLTVNVCTATADSSSTRVTSGTYWAWGAQVNRGTTPTPYLATTTAARIGIPLSYDAAASAYGILVEPAATNLCLRSEDATTTWTNNNSTETANSTTAPDGTTTADTLTASSTSNAYLAQNVGSRTDNAAHTLSCYLKKGTSNFAILVDTNMADGTSSGAWFDLNNGVVGTKQANVTTHTITSIGNGWYRCTITGTNAASVNTQIQIYVADADNSTNVTNGNTIFVWGAQVETGTVATSYIPTLGATVTRAVDNVRAAGTTFPLAGTGAGTLYAYARKLYATSAAAPNTFPRYVNLDGGNNSEVATLCYEQSGNGEVIYQQSGNAAQVGANGLSAGTGTADAALKLAASWSTNDVAISLDGATVVTDVANANPNGTTTFYVGDRYDTTRTQKGFIYQSIYLPRAMSDAELEAITA
jgi:hypothetical protein